MFSSVPRTLLGSEVKAVRTRILSFDTVTYPGYECVCARTKRRECTVNAFSPSCIQVFSKCFFLIFFLNCFPKYFNFICLILHLLVYVPPPRLLLVSSRLLVGGGRTNGCL